MSIMLDDSDPENKTTREEWRDWTGICRIDGPAVTIREYPSGELVSEEWRSAGKLHNPSGPACIKYYGPTMTSREYYVSNMLHRDDGPARVTELDGFNQIEAYYQYGKKHRLDGPAFIERHEELGIIIVEEYWQDGKRHRIGGPAFIVYDDNGAVERMTYFVNGEEVSPPTPQPAPG